MSSGDGDNRMTVNDLDKIGVKQMDDAEIREFLTTEGVGVLGLATEGPPYMLPISFDFDGDSTLHFTFVIGDSSRKTMVSRRAETARFLVYDDELQSDWRSVLLTGSIDAVPSEDWDAVLKQLDNAWRPVVFQEAQYAIDVDIFAFSIEEQHGIKHGGLPEDP